MKLFIATGNKNKFISAQKHITPFGIQLEQANIKLVELQGEETESIATHKAEQAFEILQMPVAITDTGWKIPSLNGFPGPYMHSMVEWFSSEDFLALMKNKTDRSIVFENICVYKDSSQVKIFRRDLVGQILKEPKGKGIVIDMIVTFRKDKKTIAECDEQNISMVDDESDSISDWSKLGKWLSESKSLKQ
jgi:non-canonical purine NTP pyrophosphatase (RdgB/HAM1 family)